MKSKRYNANIQISKDDFIKWSEDMVVGNNDPVRRRRDKEPTKERMEAIS